MTLNDAALAFAIFAVLLSLFNTWRDERALARQIALALAVAFAAGIAFGRWLS